MVRVSVRVGYLPNTDKNFMHDGGGDIEYYTPRAKSLGLVYTNRYLVHGTCLRTTITCPWWRQRHIYLYFGTLTMIPCPWRRWQEIDVAIILERDMFNGYAAANIISERHIYLYCRIW